MEVNELQALVDAARDHLLAMHDKVDDLKASDPTDGKEDVPDGYTGYLDGAWQMAILNLFEASGLLQAKIREMKA
jgi:hypothetical protein